MTSDNLRLHYSTSMGEKSNNIYMNKQYKKILWATFIALTIASSLIAMYLNSNSIDSDKKEIEKKIEILLQSKNFITDGSKVQITGEMKGNEYVLSSGGFTVYELYRESNGFVKNEIKAGNIKYKPQEYNYSYYGYSRANSREKPQTCYDDSYKFLLFGSKDEPKTNFVENTFSDLKNFPDAFATKFYVIKHQLHPTESYLEKENNGSVYNNLREVKYSEIKSYYAIKEDKSAITQALITNIFVAIVCSLLLTLGVYFYLKNFHKVNVTDEKILNIQWQNVENKSILTLKPKSLGKIEATIVENNIAKNGIAKLSDDKKLLTLTFFGTEFYYKILICENLKLEIQNLSDGILSRYQVLGTDAYIIETKFNDDTITINNNNIV